MSSEFTDPGSRADPKKPHLLTENVKTRDFSPFLGTEVKGVQVSQLSKEGLDEVALLVAERKVVVFRDQDFKDIAPEKQIEIARCVENLALLLVKVTLRLDRIQPLWPHSAPSDVR